MSPTRDWSQTPLAALLYELVKGPPPAFISERSLVEKVEILRWSDEFRYEDPELASRMGDLACKLTRIPALK